MNKDALEKAIAVYLGPECYTEADVDAVRPHIIEAIAAYLAASGEARDAARYREFRNNFGLAVWGEDGQIAWHEDEIDAAIDAAIAAREGESDE